MKFLVVRFRQMGDAVLATALFNAIKLNFPDAETHFVLNDRIADLFEGHPSIDRIVRFTDDERHKPAMYLAKIWRLMRREHYDVVIDMRSTVNTLPFSLFATPFATRCIGIRKPYTVGVFRHRLPECATDCDMVTHDLHLLSPLQSLKPLNLNVGFSLHPKADEIAACRASLQSHGVDLRKPILMCGVVTKLRHKMWRRDYMVETLRRVIAEFPSLQLIFNYAPGVEEAEARSMYEELGRPAHIYIDVQCPTMRSLAAMATLCSGYFGNEGGARHIAHAVGCPSLVVVSPNVCKTIWVPQNDVKAIGIAASDVVSAEKLATMSYEEQFDSISADYVWNKLKLFLAELN